MTIIFGSIGYTVLKKQNKKIIIFADMHSTLTKCSDLIQIADWFKTKFTSSKILLEEVNRDNVNLGELWSKSDHTQRLKQLYLDNPTIIQAIDIRPQLIPFSWELDNDNFITLKQYLHLIDKFFCLYQFNFYNNIPDYNRNKIPHTKLGKHFLKIKHNYRDYLLKYNNVVNHKLTTLIATNNECMHNINQILNNIMEWYVCACIYFFSQESIIVHTGLVHSEHIIEWLTTHYNFDVVSGNGINKMKELDYAVVNGCVELPDYLDTQFGGF